MAVTLADIKKLRDITGAGMMDVKKALEALDGVTSAVPSHEKACAVIEMNKPVSEEEIKKAVEGAGYEFVSMT